MALCWIQAFSTDSCMPILDGFILGYTPQWLISNVGNTSGCSVFSIFAPSSEGDMDSVVMKDMYLKYLIFVFVFVPLSSCTDIDCLENSAPDCDFYVSLERSGREEHWAYDIKQSDADICKLRPVQDGLIQIVSLSTRCLRNAPRIIYAPSYAYGFAKKKLVIEKCVIYWKDIHSLAYFGYQQHITELILDDCEDEFVTRESYYFHHCLSINWDRHNSTEFFHRPVTIHLLSSVARPLSGAFNINSWSNIKELGITG